MKGSPYVTIFIFYQLILNFLTNKTEQTPNRDIVELSDSSQGINGSAGSIDIRIKHYKYFRPMRTNTSS